MKVANFGKCRTAVFLASALAILATVSVCVGGGFGADLQMARMNVTTVGGGVPVAGGASCPAEGSPDVDFNPTYAGIDKIGWPASNNNYKGLSYTPASNVTICRIGFRFRDLDTPNNCVVTAYIYTATGTGDSTHPDTLVATSTNTHTWDSEWADGTWKYFTFNNASLTGSTRYIVIVGNGNVESEYNYVALENGTASVSGIEWQCAYDQTDWAGGCYRGTETPAIRIYYYD